MSYDRFSGTGNLQSETTKRQNCIVREKLKLDNGRGQAKKGEKGGSCQASYVHKRFGTFGETT